MGGEPSHNGIILAPAYYCYIYSWTLHPSGVWGRKGVVYLPTFLKSIAWDFQFRHYPNFRRCPHSLTTSERCRRLPKVSRDFRALPKMTQWLPIIPAVLTNWPLNLHLIGLWARSSHLSVRREKLAWMHEISILDRQARDSRIMHESWQV